MFFSHLGDSVPAMDILPLLDTCAYFKGLSPKNKKALAAVCVPRAVAKRDIVFLEGEKGQALYLLASGSVQLVKTSAEGKEVVIRTVEPGEVFAEVILFEQETYPVTATAIRKSGLYRLPKKDFLSLLDSSGFRDDFMAFLMKRMRYLADRILTLTACDVEDRFFQFLRDQYGEKETYRLAIPKKDLAAAIGTTPETLSRLIVRLSAEDKISWAGKTLTLKAGFRENE